MTLCNLNETGVIFFKSHHDEGGCATKEKYIEQSGNV